MHCKISDSNSKIGRMPNISLSPVAGCRSDAPCKKDCYALKAYRQYPAVRAAWDNNLEMATTDLDAFIAEIFNHIIAKKKPPRYFRWHVSGDILSERYFAGMVLVALNCPNTRFLAFTKCYDFVNSFEGEIPANLTIVFSAWPGLPMNNPKSLPVAYMQDGTETRVPVDAIECPGSCDTCGMCWQLPTIGKDVVFHKH